MTVSIKRKLYTGFIIAFLLAGGIALSTWLTFRDQIGEAKWVNHTHEVITQAEYAQKMVVEMQTGRRGFIATGNKRFLEVYDKYKAQIIPELDKLGELVKDNPQQVKHVTKLRMHFDELLNYWVRLGDQADELDRADVNRIIDQEKDLMDRIRRDMDDIETEEHRLLSTREKVSSSAIKRTNYILIFGSILVQLIILFLIRTVLAEFKTRRKAEEKLNETNSELEQLVAEVQKANETLEMQQEELRQTNEELTRQTESLQASEEELRVQEEELRQINTELEEKNEVVEMARQALVNKAQELETTGKYKSEFLANMSHELRTPLNSVLILARLLSDNKPKNLTEKQIEYANIIHKSGADLLALINDILDLSKIEAGKVEFTLESVPVSTIMNDIQQQFQFTAEEKGVAFVTKVTPDAPQSCVTDKMRVEQVIKNLLSNAFKFTPKGGKVALVIDSTYSYPRGYIPLGEKVLAISVIDNGIGIPADKQKIVFEAFQQADGSTSRKYGGTGLGLSISKELIRKLGGDIDLKSAEGVGSTFTIYLPVEKIEKRKTIPPEKAKADAQPGVNEQSLVKDDRDAIQPNDKTMLIVEDDVNFATIVRDFARRKGYKTIVAMQGDEGLFYAMRYKPSAIILDLMLPVLDGNNVLKSLKNNDKLKHIPVHIISAVDNLHTANSGEIAFLNKPVTIPDLEDAFSLIEKHIKSALKRVLVIADPNDTEHPIPALLKNGRLEVDCDIASGAAEANKFLEEYRYDCVIADIGKNVQGGITLLQQLQENMNRHNTPVIIHLDQDLNNNEELQLKKISSAIIRESSYSEDRLMDELELFLYKLQEKETKAVPRKAAVQESDDLLKSKKVLLVDDDMRNVFALSALLEQQMMEVVTANDGREALTQLQEHKHFDIVLMDIMMPEMDGYEAMRRIRKDLHLTNLPVIALTAKAMPGDQEKCIEAGASDYITKPIDSGKLFSLMKVWLAQ